MSGYEYKSYYWFSEWDNKGYWANVLKRNGKIVWKLLNSEHPISERDAIKIYEAELLG